MARNVLVQERLGLVLALDSSKDKAEMHDSPCGGFSMKIALLCAVAFVMLSSVPLVSRQGNAAAQERTSAQSAPQTDVIDSARARILRKIDAKSIEAHNRLVVETKSAQ